MSQHNGSFGHKGSLPIDALRGLLILLGIFLHAARPYDGSGDWLVVDRVGAEWLSYVPLVIGFFRMPLFFFLSGLLSWHALTRRTNSAYMTSRVLRLGIPLAFAAVFMNALVAWLLDGRANMGQPATLSYWLRGEWLLHLWFLLFLIIYSATLVLIRPLVARLPVLSRGRAQAAVALGFVGAHFLALAVAQVFPAVYAAIGSYGTIFWLLHFGTYFLLGAAACRLFGNFRLIVESPINSPGILFLGALTISLHLFLATAGKGELWEIARNAVDGLLLWCVLYLLLALCSRLSEWIPRLCIALAEASYSIYLIHHSIVVVLAVALQHALIPGELKFAVIVLATFAGSVVFHLLFVQRYAVSRMLINGQWEGDLRHALPLPGKIFRTRSN